jgi:hypothetical protein
MSSAHAACDRLLRRMLATAWACGDRDLVDTTQGFLVVVSAAFAPPQRSPLGPLCAKNPAAFLRARSVPLGARSSHCTRGSMVLRPALRHGLRPCLGMQALRMRAWSDRGSSGGWGEDQREVQPRDGAYGASFAGQNAAGLPEVQLNNDRWERDAHRERREGKVHALDVAFTFPTHSLHVRVRPYAMIRARTNTRTTLSSSDASGWRIRAGQDGSRPWFQHHDAVVGTGANAPGNSARQNIADLMAPESSSQAAGQSSGVSEVDTAGGWVEGQAQGMESAGSPIVQQAAGGQMMMLVPIKMMVFVDGTWLYYR